MKDYLPFDHQKKKPTLSTSRTQKLSKGKTIMNEKKKDSKTKGPELVDMGTGPCWAWHGPGLAGHQVTMSGLAWPAT